MDCVEHYKFINKPLPYEYDELEPYIDEKTMMLHHDRHLQTYIDNLNKALQPYEDYHNWTLKRLLCCEEHLPFCIREEVHNNAGGVFNHRFYFDGMGSPESENGYNDSMLESSFTMAMDRHFWSYDKFKKEMKKAALSVFGSGYAWLVINCRREFEIVITHNQDTVLPFGYVPLLNIDVWEHAYYLKHYNKRADYIDDWFKVIDWDVVESRFNFETIWNPCNDFKRV